MLTSTIIIGSQTNAMRAQKCLNSANIRCEVIKSTADRSRGCIYALRVYADVLKAALLALDKCNVKYEN